MKTGQLQQNFTERLYFLTVSVCEHSENAERYLNCGESKPGDLLWRQHRAKYLFLQICRTRFSQKFQVQNECVGHQNNPPKPERPLLSPTTRFSREWARCYDKPQSLRWEGRYNYLNKLFEYKSVVLRDGICLYSLMVLFITFSFLFTLDLKHFKMQTFCVLHCQIAYKQFFVSDYTNIPVLFYWGRGGTGLFPLNFICITHACFKLCVTINKAVRAYQSQINCFLFMTCFVILKRT